ncbi:MAG: response regulator [Acidobacteriota bacterium]|nr:MAG: response regulator [Acidobacteriota bacterium]
MSFERSSSTPTLTLSPAQFSAVFPFHLALDSELSIVQVGPSLQHIFPDVAVGGAFAELFGMRRPDLIPTFSLLKDRTESLILWEHLLSHQLLRGEVIYLEESNHLMLIWHPWLTDPGDLVELGLTLKDFAPHDPLFDLLNVVQSHRSALEDVKKLVERLSQQRSELRKANQTLFEQNAALRQADEQLIAQQAETRKLALIASRTDNAVVLTDAKGKTIWVNEGFVRLTGFEMDEAIGKTPGSLLQGQKSDPKVVELMRSRIRQGKGFSVELLNYKKSGERYWVAIEVQPIHDESGAISNFMGIESDITERKRFEEQLMATTAAANSASRAKSEFLATMSHEIRTPMNGILGMAELLMQTRLGPEQHEFVEAIQSSGVALLKIINDILDFSKVEAGKMSLEETDFEILGLVEGVLELEGRRAQQKGIELVSIIPPEVPEAFRGDEGRLRQILLNLVGNAVKFTERGSVTVRVNFPEQTDSGSLLRFEVTDTGVGVSDEQKKLLFTPFSQLDATPSRKYGGTGLGLAIARRLVSLMKGQIGLESQPGSGSTFWFEVPVNAVKDQPDRKILGGFEDTPILVYSKTPLFTKSLLNMFERIGVAAVAMDQMDQMLGQLSRPQNQKRQVVLIDETPGEDPDEIASRIRESREGPSVHLVLLCTFASLAASAKKEASLYDDYVLKPIKRERLINAIQGGPGPKTVPKSAPLTSVETAELRPEPSAQPAPETSLLKILLVEDNEINRRVAQAMIGKLGHQTEVAVNGQDALEALGKAQYDLILMDCQMPVMDGFEATRLIRSKERSGHTTYSKPIHIIAMTANALARDREECLEAGMNDYLSKPVSVQDLKAAIERFVTERA